MYVVYTKKKNGSRKYTAPTAVLITLNPEFNNQGAL